MEEHQGRPQPRVEAAASVFFPDDGQQRQGPMPRCGNHGASSRIRLYRLVRLKTLPRPKTLPDRSTGPLGNDRADHRRRIIGSDPARSMPVGRTRRAAGPHVDGESPMPTPTPAPSTGRAAGDRASQLHLNGSTCRAARLDRPKGCAVAISQGTPSLGQTARRTATSPCRGRPGPWQVPGFVPYTRPCGRARRQPARHARVRGFLRCTRPCDGICWPWRAAPSRGLSPLLPMFGYHANRRRAPARPHAASHARHTRSCLVVEHYSRQTTRQLACPWGVTLRLAKLWPGSACVPGRTAAIGHSGSGVA